MWGSGAGDSADWELSKENVQPLRQGRRVDVLNTSLQTAADEQTAQKVAEQRRNFELEIRTYSGEDPLSPWHQYVLWMEQHCPRGGHEGNLDGLLTQCIQRFSADARYHQDPRFVALVIKQACSSQQTLETFKSMFSRHIGTKLTMFYRAWSAQLELAGNMVRADLVLAEGERLGAQPADELAEARRKLQTRVASAVAAGRLPAPPAQINRAAVTEERHALGALRGSSEGVVPRQRVGPVQAGRPGTLATAGHQPTRHNQRLNVFVDENAPAVPASAAGHGTAELAPGRAAQKENVRKAGPWGAPQKASKRTTPATGGTAPAFRVYEDAGSGAAHGSPITVKPGALAARAAPAPAAAAALDNIPVAYFEPPNDKVQVMYCKDVIYAGAGEVSFEELRAARWKKDNRVLLEQRRMHEEMQRRMQEEMQRAMQEMLRRSEEMERRNELLERQVQELRARAPPAVTQAGSLHGSLGQLSNVSGGSSSLAGHSNNLSGSTVLASPTVNTRDAMNYVREVLNRTVDTSVQLPRLGPVAPTPVTVPFTVYEEPEAAVSKPPAQPAAAAPFSIYEESARDAQKPPFSVCEEPAPDAQKPPAAAAPFTVYEDGCDTAAAAADQGDSDQENRPPADCPPPPPRRRPPQILVDAVDIPTEPLEPPPASATARRPLQFDDELTGFVPLSEDVTFANGDLSQFAAAAGRVASTPFAPPPPAPAAAAARAKRDEEEGEFTANLKSVRAFRPPGDRTGSNRTTPSEGGALTPIMERSREQYKSSSSSSGSDMSRQSRCDVSAPASAAQPWRQRVPSTSDRSHQLSCRAPPPQLTQSSGYLGDRSGSVRPASAGGAAAADCSIPRRPDPAGDVSAVTRRPDPAGDVSSMSRRPDSGDVSGVEAPDVSMARQAERADCSALRPGEAGEKAAELSLVPAGLSPAAPPTELSAFQPPPELSALQPPPELSALQPPPELSALQPPAELSVLQPPVELSVLKHPTYLSAMKPSAELSMLRPPSDLSDLKRPAELSALQPSADSVFLPAAEPSHSQTELLSTIQPPAELSALQPPAELSPVQPPAELSPIQPPPALSPTQPPSTALSSLTLEEPAPAVKHPDPWDSELVAGLLRSLSRPVHTRQRYRKVAGKLPNLARKEVDLDGRRLSVTLIGEGAYARVYHAVDRESGAVYCLKVQPEGGDWEFYVVDELRERLAGEQAEESPFLMTVERMAAFDNGSVLFSEYEPAGTLLDIRNKLVNMYQKFDERLAMLFTAEMLGAVSAVHRAGMVHGDVKPDNFLLRSRPLEHVDQLTSDLRCSHHPRLLQLIDFGRAIDLTLLPPGTTFTRVVTTDDFTCPEMKDDREWTFQPDMFGVAASAHVLLFGKYLKLTRRQGGDGWTISGTIRRFWSPVWAEFFSTFLNIPSCTDLPDLTAWRRRFLELALGRELDAALKRLVTTLKQR